MRSWIIAVVAVLVSFVGCPRAAQAQRTCTSHCPPPTATITPATESVGTSQVVVTITLCDTSSLGADTVWQNGAIVTNTFRRSTTTGTAHCYIKTTLIGTVSLVLGANTLQVDVWSTAGGTLQEGSAAVTYNYQPPAHNLTVTVSPPTLKGTAGLSAGTTFTITNTGNVVDTAWFNGSCNGPVFAWCGGLSIGGAILQPGHDTTMGFGWQLAGAGLNGTAVLTATENNGAVASSAQTVTTVPAAGLDFVDVNPGVSYDRGNCLTIAMGPHAAFECDALRLTHTLPAVRTMNTERVPTLIYNWDFSNPIQRVAALLTIATQDTATLDSVRGRLYKRPHGTGSWVAVDQSAWWRGSDWNDTAKMVTRRLEDYWSSSDPTGYYDLSYATTRFYHSSPGAPQHGSWAVNDSSSGQIINVNRMASPYGAGWWLVGLEQLMFYGGASRDTIVWIGGDGSTNLYVDNQGTGQVWRPVTMVGARDSITWVPQYHLYQRNAPHNTRITFDSSTGRMGYRINRLGESTRFIYHSTTGPALDTIEVWTPQGNSSHQGWYTFIYGGSGVLQQVNAPGPKGAGTRAVVFSDSTTLSGASPEIWKIRDPDGDSVLFNQDPASLLRIALRVDKRGDTTTFGYGLDVQGFGYSHLALHESGVSDITRTLVMYDNFGQSVGWMNRSSIFAMPPESTYIQFHGPRSNAIPSDAQDVTTFWVDKWWQPTMIRDASGARTIIRRDNQTYPTRVTQTIAPFHRVETAAYDPRGNIQQVVDFSTYRNGAFATTTYRWDPMWDRVQLIDPPMHDSLSFTYDPTWGNRITQTDAEGNQISYSYAQYNRLTSTTLPGTQPDLVVYDPVLGNVTATRTSKKYWSLYRTDVLGRDSVTITPTDSVSALDSVAVQSSGVVNTDLHDVDDRDSIVTITGPAMNNVTSQTITISNTYDAEGDLTAVTRSGAASGILKTSATYDAAGRKITDVATDGNTTKTLYDAAGNPTVITTRRNYTVSNSYDVLNRLAQRIKSPTSYSPWSYGIPLVPNQLPNTPYSTPYGGLTIAGDTATFTYDSAGRLIEADNGDAHVSRSYQLNGLLANETQRVRTIAGTDFTQHVYTVAYHYDLDGKRDTLYFPPSLLHNTNGPVGGSESYAYDLSGRIDTVIDPMGNKYHYGYNARGDQDTIAYSTGPLDVRTFDDDGNLVAETLAGLSTAGGGYSRNVNRWFDARGKLTHSVNHLGIKDNVYVYYSGLGYVVADSTTWQGTNGINEPESVDDQNQFTYDALGNKLSDVSGASGTYGGTNATLFIQHETWTFDPTSGRLASGTYTTGDPNNGLVDTTWYDPSGNVYFSTQDTTTSYHNGHLMRDRASFYDAAEQLRQVNYRAYQNSGLQVNFVIDSETYRYDALGRKVLMRTAQDCLGSTQGGLNPPCNWSWVWRGVFDGNEELAEIQTIATSPEADTLPFQIAYNAGDENYKFGRVLYTLGTEVDKPLAVTRIDNADAENSYFLFPPISYIPIWNGRGQYDVVDIPVCPDSAGTPRCPIWSWEPDLITYYHAPLTIFAWMGSELEGRTDASGTVDQRSRTYDPHTGRFTQEDPLGLGGGLNAYGFAAGDPVNYSDPFGLLPCCWSPVLDAQIATSISQGLIADAAKRVKSALMSTADLFATLVTAHALSGAPEMEDGGFGGSVGEGIGSSAGPAVSATVEDGVAEISAAGANGEIRIMGNMSREGSVITLDKAHIEGAGPGSSSFSELRGIVQDFGRQQNASRVIIQGAARTTGRHAGQVPRPITVDVPPQ